MNILLINGPNLNLLGTREPEIYGNKTLKEIEKDLMEAAESKKTLLECFQSNHEGEIVDKIQASMGNVNGILINAGALTHTSVALRDALVGSNIPFIEVHISNIYSREEFRRKSLISKNCKSVICGFGLDSYKLALYSIDH